METRFKNLGLVWDLSSGKKIFETTVDFDARQILISDTGQLVAMRGDDQISVFSIKDPVTPIAVRKFPARSEDAEFLDDQRLAIVGYWGTADIWIPAKDELETIELVAMAACVDYCSKTQRLVTGLHSGDILIHHLGDPNRDTVELNGHHDSVFDIAVSADDRWILSSSWDGTTRLWDPHSPRK